MNRYVMAAFSLMLTAGAQADRIRPDVEVNVPPEVFSSGGQRAQPCNRGQVVAQRLFRRAPRQRAVVVCG